MGSDGVLLTFCWLNGGFNSRSRMGSDQDGVRDGAGADCFNSRSRMGSDQTASASACAKPRFQFTLPHGERLSSPTLASKLSCFNSRSRMGSDAAETHGITTLPVSIHAPAWGATEARHQGPFEAKVSIHAPAWGATVPLVKDQRVRPVSIHAPAWGATSIAARTRS